MHPDQNVQELLDLAYRDDLTGLYNRRYFSRVVAEPLGEPDCRSLYCFFVLDIDFFKEVNDSYGHKNGDRALAALANLLRENFLGEEIPIRFAGDEFLVFLPNTDPEQGFQRAGWLVERARDVSVPLPGDASPIRFTLSVGVAGFPEHGAHWEEVLERADQALYAAKQAGRDRAALPGPASEHVPRGDDLSRIFPCRAYIGDAGPLRSILGVLDRLSAASTPEPRFLVCRAGPGGGKTRLLHEAARAASERGVPVLRLPGTEQLRGICYGALVRGLIQHAGSGEAVREGFSDRTDSADDALWDAFFLRGSRNPGPADPARAQGFFERLLRGVSGPNRTLALLVDDADCLDEETVELLRTIHRTGGPGFRCLCVVTGAPGRQGSPDASEGAASDAGLPAWLDEQGVSAQEIPPLAPGDVGRMLEALFPTLRTDPSLVEQMHARSRGNPLYVEEALKLMIQRESLVYRRSAWTWAVAGLEDLPGTLDSLLEARLASLDPEVQDLVRKASVLGTDVDPDLLFKLGDANEGHVLDLLEKARKCGILRADRPWREGAFHFNADETRALSYDRIPEEDRIAWHLELARLHQSVSEGSAHLNLGALQHHYRLAGEEEACRKIADRLAPLGPATSLSLRKRPAQKARKDLIHEPVALPQEKLAGVVSIFHLLRAAMQTWRLYPESSQAVSQACRRLHEGFLAALADTPSVHFSEAEGTLLINGEALGWKGEEKRVVDAFCRTLSAVGLKDVVFLRGLAPEEIQRFLKTWVEVQQDASDAPARWEAFENSPGMDHVRVNARVYVALSETALFPAAGAGEDERDPPERFRDMPDLLSSVRARLDTLRQGGGEGGAITEEVTKTRELLEKIYAFLASGAPDAGTAARLAQAAPAAPAGVEPETAASPAGPDPEVTVLEPVREDDVRCALADILSGDAAREARGYKRVSEAGTSAVEALYFTLTQTDDAHEGRLSARFLTTLCPHLPSRILADVQRPADPAVKKRLLQYAAPLIEPPTRRREVLGAALESEHPVLAMEALHQIETDSGGDPAPLLLEALPRCPDRTRMEIYAALARLGESACVPHLLDTLDTWRTRQDERTVRGLESACEALGHFNDPRIVEKLQALLACRSRLPWRRIPPPGLRKAAVKTLLRIGGEPAAGVLKRHESDPDPWIRLRARQFLQKHGPA